MYYAQLWADEHAQESLRAPLAELARFGLIPGVVAGLTESEPALLENLVSEVTGTVAAYAASGNPDLEPRLAEHAAEISGDVIGLFRGGPLGDLAHVAKYARWCSEGKFPLEAVLSAYRSMQEHLLTWLRDAALEAADDSAPMQRVVGRVTEFVLRYTEAQTSVAAAEYVAHTRAVAEAEGDQRNQLLQLLLHGYDESDPRVATLLRRSGYLDQRQSYCVVVAQPVDRTEMHNTARANRLTRCVASSHRTARRAFAGCHS